VFKRVSKKKQEQLRVQLSDAEASEILANAIDDVPGFIAPPEIPIPERRLLIGVASLAIGDTVFTRQLLRHLSGQEHLLLAARHFLWTGDDATLRTQLPKMLETLPQVAPFVEMNEVASALESVGAAHEASQVRARAGNSRRRLLTDWEASDWNVLPAANAADTVADFVHGMLGAIPDAPRGRLRLRLSLPDWLDFMTVHNLRIGDALISLRYVCEQDSMRYYVEQFAGAVPVRLILEPTFTRNVKSVAVDSAPADLIIQLIGGRFVAPVQLMLDHERALEFELE
jgi:hypothetical protein